MFVGHGAGRYALAFVVQRPDQRVAAHLKRKRPSYTALQLKP